METPSIAFAFCVFLAFLLMALLQREARKKVQPMGMQLRVEGRDKLKLTAKALLSAFDGIAIYTISQRVFGKIIIQRECTNLSMAQRYVLWALSFPSLNDLITDNR
jgi:hypothetical protein